MTYLKRDVGSDKASAGESGGAGTGKGRLSVLTTRLSAVTTASRELELPMCVTCSTQTSYKGKDLDVASSDSDYKCAVCLDPRQYIGVSGQKWTSLKALAGGGQEKSRSNDFVELIPGSLWSFKTRPAFGIGQRAFLIKDPNVKGLVMWDCVAYLDDDTLETIDRISDGESISHMVVSHPHYYSTTAIWLAAFPTMKLWLAKEDYHAWYQRDDLEPGVAKRIKLVDQVQTPVDNCHGHINILLLGGHFPGSLVLLWKDEVLFIADTIQVVPSGLYKSQEPQRPDVASVTFLWSYPNQIPLSGAEIKRVCAPLEKVSFDKAFGAFEGFDIWGHAKDKILQSRDIFCRRMETQ